MALAAADALVHLQPGPRTAVTRAIALAGLGRRDEAVAVLTAVGVPEGVNDRADVAANLANLHYAAGRPQAARDILAAVVDRLDGAPRLEAQLRRSLAVMEDALGHAQAAAWERKRADELAHP